MFSRLIGAGAPGCPNEVDFLAYHENRLSTGNRAGIERHIADCHDCRQVLALLGRDSMPAAAVSDQVVSQQTGRILAYIETDERNRSKPREKERVAARGPYVSLPRFATVGLVVVALAVAGVFLFTRQEAPADAAMASLKLALKNERLSETRISGGFDYSRYPGTTRGSDISNDDFHLTRAENKLKPVAEQQSAAASDRLVLARVYLARGTRESAGQALMILNQLTKQGLETPEILNDIGVAYFQMDRYDDAMSFFSKALTKSASYNEALFNLALTEGLVRRDEDARRDWQKFIDQTTDEKWKTEARNRLNSLIR